MTEPELEPKYIGFKSLALLAHTTLATAEFWGFLTPIDIHKNNAPVSYVAQSKEAKKYRRDMQLRTG